MNYLGIIEDDVLVRNSLASIFSTEKEISCAILAESVEDFLQKAEHVPQMDIVLSDIGLPGINGLKAIPLIKSKFAGVSVVMLSVYADNDRIFNALCAGAVGYLQKGMPLNEVLNSVKIICNGGSVMSPLIARKVMEYFAPKRTYNEPLTAREYQVINGIVDGLSYKMIAARLNITLETVRQHIKNIYRKLQINSKAELISRSARGEL
jgi:DNA-binding NarL/FixJ family response regulator